MLRPFTGTAIDPITNRLISDACWNGWHEQATTPDSTCASQGCLCLCHAYDPLATREVKEALSD